MQVMMRIRLYNAAPIIDADERSPLSAAKHAPEGGLRAKPIHVSFTFWQHEGILAGDDDWGVREIWCV
jgi:hypothetical protein